jgi:hypothetical protein
MHENVKFAGCTCIAKQTLRTSFQNGVYIHIRKVNELGSLLLGRQETWNTCQNNHNTSLINCSIPLLVLIYYSMKYYT